VTKEGEGECRECDVGKTTELSNLEQDYIYKQIEKYYDIIPVANENSVTRKFITY
jgi:hypothetical protein